MSDSQLFSLPLWFPLWHFFPSAGHTKKKSSHHLVIKFVANLQLMEIFFSPLAMKRKPNKEKERNLSTEILPTKLYNPQVILAQMKISDKSRNHKSLFHKRKFRRRSEGGICKQFSWTQTTFSERKFCGRHNKDSPRSTEADWLRWGKSPAFVVPLNAFKRPNSGVMWDCSRPCSRQIMTIAHLAREMC